MDKFMRGIGKMILEKERVFFKMKMGTNTKVNGNRIKKMVKEYKVSLMVINIWVNLKMI